jgi:hypothetical protein
MFRLNCAGQTGVPMKRSTQVSLVVMTAAGIGAGAYALTPNDNCRRSPSSATAREPQDAMPTARDEMPTAREPQGTIPTASARDCRSSRGGSGGHGFSSLFSSGYGYGGPGYGYGSPGATTTVANGTSAATSASRGGFGSTGQALASFAGS